MAQRGRTRSMWLAVLAIAATVAAGTMATVQGQAGGDKGEKHDGEKRDSEKRESGIYLEAAESGGKADAMRLEATMPEMEAQGVAGSMMTMGFKKPRMITKVSGDKASLRTPAQPSFLFVFGQQSRQQMMDPTAAMTAMSALPRNTSSPKDYALLRLVVSEGDRAYDSGKGQQVKCSVENVAPHVFRVKPAAALEPGEYGFAYLTQGVAGMVWDFGVDAATTK
jgi:hypothetical protein